MDDTTFHNNVKIEALKHTVSLLISLLPEEQKNKAILVLQSMMEQDYKKELMSIHTSVTGEKANEFDKLLIESYKEILESIKSFDASFEALG